jgi:uncharacterized protein (UPF0371 family)
MVVDKRGRIRFQSGLLHRAGIDRGDRVVVAAARGRVCVTSGNALALDLLAGPAELTDVEAGHSANRRSDHQVGEGHST